MRFSTVVASMLPLSVLAAPSLVKRQYDGQQNDTQQYEGQLYDSSVNQYFAQLDDSKAYMRTAYDQGWKIDKLQATFNQYKYKEALDNMNLDDEKKQLLDCHAPMQDVLIKVGQIIENAHCSAKQLYTYVYNYKGDDEAQYHDLQSNMRNVVFQLKGVSVQFTSISGGKPIAAYFESVQAEFKKCPLSVTGDGRPST